MSRSIPPARTLANGLVALGVLSALVVSCAVERADIVDAFVDAYPTATPDQVACVVDDLIERYGIEGLEVELNNDPVAQPFQERQFKTMVLCGMTELVAEPLDGQLARLDVADDKRPCVIDALTADITEDDLDVLLSGELNDTFYTQYFDALDRCGALP